MTTAALWTKHRPLARAISRDFFLPGSETQDVEQEAQIGLWLAARDYDKDKGPFPAFAGLVIRRHMMGCVEAANRGKHRPLNQSVSARDEEGGLLIERLPHLHQVTDVVEDKERLRGVLAAIDSDLTEFERHCVVGIASGLSYLEIDGNTKRVDNALSSAREKLRRVA